ncbi:hypothetical protein HDV00_003253 [Rhizophlyctis rosea]|nr:hypothetical protein HDV00_003253 [Rhizophlyctis rosea]
MRFSLASALAATFTLTSVNALTSSLQQVSNFGTNPSGSNMYIYVPTQLAINPPIIVAIHYCTGSAQAYFSGTQYASLADSHGFIVVYPSSQRSGACWDVSSKASLTHNGGSDSLAIVNMAKYAQQKYNGGNIYVTGTSSGAMMTNVLAGAYPDVFSAAAAFSGVPDGCFADPSGTTPANTAAPYWNSQCSGGSTSKTQSQWADLVKSYYPDYTGPRPPFQVWHGSTDTTLYPNNFNETVKEWTGVFGLSLTPTSVQANNPQSQYTKYTYGTQVEAYWAQGVGHTVPEHADEVLRWFGLTNLKPGQSQSTTTTTTTTRTTTTTTTTQPITTTTQAQSGATCTVTNYNDVTVTVTPTVTVTAGGNPPATTTTTTTTTSQSQQTNCAAKYGQCGGQGFTGPTCCQSGSTCKASNQYYSQCL